MLSTGGCQTSKTQNVSNQGPIGEERAYGHQRPSQPASQKPDPKRAVYSATNPLTAPRFKGHRTPVGWVNFQ